MPHRLQRIFPRVQGAKAASSRCAALTAKYWRRQRLGAGVWEVLAALAPDLPWIFASSESDTPQARLNFGEFWVSGGAVSSVWIWRILGIRQCWVSGDAGAGCPIMPQYCRCLPDRWRRAHRLDSAETRAATRFPKRASAACTLSFEPEATEIKNELIDHRCERTAGRCGVRGGIGGRLAGARAGAGS